MGERIVDLSLTFKRGMRGVDFDVAATIAEHGYNATTLHIYSHAGTHLDAPSHSTDGKRTVDHLAIEKCVGDALVVDMSHKGSGSLLLPADFAPYSQYIGYGSRVLIRTDWDDHANLPDYRDDFPRISLELAEWFATRGVWLLGLETPSVASLKDLQEMQSVHRMMLDKEIVIVESLTNLRHLQQVHVYFVALPLKIENCDGSPIRAIAIERNE